MMIKSHSLKEWSTDYLGELKSRLIKSDKDNASNIRSRGKMNNDHVIDMKHLHREFSNLKAHVSCLEISLEVIKNDIRKTRLFVESQTKEFTNKITSISMV